MEAFSYIRIALKQLRANALTTALIVFALSLGVGVIVSISAFLSISQQFQEEFAGDLSSRELILRFSNSKDSTLQPVYEKRQTPSGAVGFLTEDIGDLKSVLPQGRLVYFREPATFLMSGAKLISIAAVAVTPDYFEAAEVSIESGSTFDVSAFANGEQVAVVTPNLIERIGVVGDPVGQIITTEQPKAQFVIIGVTAGEQDKELAFDMLVPYSGQGANNLYLATDALNNTQNLVEESDSYVRNRWGGKVTAYPAQDFRKLIREQQRTNIAILLVSVIGLAIAAINITNLITARVLRQTSRIAILRSIGAARSTIRNQYLVEAFLIGTAGGLLGVGIGVLLIRVLNTYVNEALPELSSTLVVRLDPQTVIIGFCVSVVVSLVFSLYPAMLASRTPVVEALQELG